MKPSIWTKAKQKMKVEDEDLGFIVLV